MGGLADDRCLVLCAADGSGRKVYLIYVVSIFVATAVRLSRDVGAVSSSSRSSMPSAAGDEALAKAVRAAALALTLAYTLTRDSSFRAQESPGNRYGRPRSRCDFGLSGRRWGTAQRGLHGLPLLVSRAGGEREEGIYRALMVAITLLSGAGGVLSLMGL